MFLVTGLLLPNSLSAQIQLPTFLDCADVSVCSFGTKDDLIHVDLKAEVSSHCISNPGLYITTQIDLFSDTIIDQTTSSLDASGEYPLGIHTITFWAADGCGGVSSCQQVVTVKDCQKPTPICHSVTIAQLPSTGIAEVWATSLEVGGSFDNITANSNLQIMVERLDQVGTGQDAPDADATGSVFVTCDDLPPMTISPIVEVAVWVGDEAGNWDYCVTTITVDHSICCAPMSASIFSFITNEVLDPVGLASVQLSGPPFINEVQVTGNAGFVGFDIFQPGQYIVTPEKKSKPLNGVTTYDLYLLQRHLLGVKLLSSPYKLIAADVNNNCNLTIADFIELRKMILSPQNDSFKYNSSWRFVDANYVFPDPKQPCGFPEHVICEIQGSNLLGANFIGVKIGDLNGDHTPDQLRESENRNKIGSLMIYIPEQQLEAGQGYEIAIRAKEFADILGYQYTLEIDKNKMEFIDIIPKWADLDLSNFGLSMTSEGILTTSWNSTGPISIMDGELQYTIKLYALKDGLLSQTLKISSSVIPSEAYDRNEELLDVQLHFTNDPGDINKFELFQNEPNPFREKTRIKFYLPEAGEATLTVHDVMGRVLFKSSENFGYGINEFDLNKSELPVQGVVYYTIQYGDQGATKRMIVNE